MSNRPSQPRMIDQVRTIDQLGTTGQHDGAGATMTIGELSELTGLSPSAIRFYQRRGLLPARPAEGGWQRYGDDTLARLAVIELAKSAGFNLDEVIRILDAIDTDPVAASETTPIWCGLAEAKLSDIDVRVRRLQQMRRLLQDALAHAHLSADRIGQVPAELGWTAGPLDGPEAPAGTPEAALGAPFTARS